MNPLACLATLALLAGCAQPPAPRVLVGQPYQMGGVWSYPREDFALTQTGLAFVLGDQRAGRRTANGERFDPAQLMAAHRTLQLPAILRVTNLENGREIEVRVNDRGPAHPGRVLGLSRRAAELLGIPPLGTAQLRIAVNGEASRALAGSLPDPETPTLQIATAPVGQVSREALAPPPGAAEGRGREARPLPGVPTAAVVAPPAPAVPGRLPEHVTQGHAQPGRLFIEAPSFSRRDLAERLAARIGGRVEATGPAGRQTFRVRVGPFGAVGAADRALEATLRAGVAEARIIVE
jgi:rare lipoprotein A